MDLGLAYTRSIRPKNKQYKIANVKGEPGRTELPDPPAVNLHDPPSLHDPLPDPFESS